jgi:hypothetical protein
MGVIAKVWRRKAFAVKALMNWGLHLADVVSFRNKGSISGKKIIVFVRAISDIRLFKQARALKNKGGFYTVFFTRVIDRNLMRSAFDEIHPLFKVETIVKEIRALSVKSDIIAIHVSSPPADICRRLIEMRLPWPVVFDQYDSYLVEHGPDFKGDSVQRMYDMCKQIEDEKFCYENADGVISKTTEIDYVGSLLNITCPVLIYPDFALEDWFTEPRKAIKSVDGRPHLVYAGGVHGISVPDNMGYSKFFDFAHNLNKQRIHFHIYPGPGQTIAAKEYGKLAGELPFFYFHRPKGPEKIQKEIAVYDFALDVDWGDKSTARQKQKSDTATGNKFATYLEAALPIIGNEGKPYVAKDVIKQKIGFVIKNDRDIISDRLLSQRNDYQSNVIEFRKKYSCSENVSQLVEFYLGLKSL